MLFACLRRPDAGGATGVADARRPSWTRCPPTWSSASSGRAGCSRAATTTRSGRRLPRRSAPTTRRRRAYCQANGIAFSWLADGSLRTRQRRSAVVRAPRRPVSAAGSTRSRSSTSGRWTRTSASTCSTSTATTGCPSTPASATATRSAKTSSPLLNDVYAANTLREPWQAGDLLLVDNIRTAHSREPFEGPREVLVGHGRRGARCRSPARERGERRQACRRSR